MKTKLFIFVIITIFLIAPLSANAYLGNEMSSNFLNRLDFGVKFGTSVSRAMGGGSADREGDNPVETSGVYMGSGLGIAAAPNIEMWLFDWSVGSAVSFDHSLDVSVFYVTKSFNTLFDGDYYMVAYDENSLIQHLYYEGTLESEFLDIPALFKTTYHMNQVVKSIPFVDQLSCSFITGPVMHVLMSSKYYVSLIGADFSTEAETITDPEVLAPLKEQTDGKYNTINAIDKIGMSWQLGVNIEYNLGREIGVPFAGIITLDFVYNIGILESFHYYETANYIIMPARMNNFAFSIGWQLSLSDLLGGGGSSSSSSQMEIEETEPYQPIEYEPVEVPEDSSQNSDEQVINEGESQGDRTDALIDSMNEAFEDMDSVE